MKAPVDRATTARVLAGIDAVLRERTAAAVERVLATAAPGYPRLSRYDCPGGARCECHRWNRPTCGFFSYSSGHLHIADHYEPWKVSPHLFAEDQS